MKLNKKALTQPRLQLQKTVDIQKKAINCAESVLAQLDKMESFKGAVLEFLKTDPNVPKSTLENLENLAADFSSDSVVSGLSQLLKDREMEDE